MPRTWQRPPAAQNNKVVSERMGHTSVSFTLDADGHVLGGMQEQADATIGAVPYR